MSWRYVNRLAVQEIVPAIAKIYTEEDGKGKQPLPKVVWLLDALNQLADDPWDEESRARPSEATWLPQALPPKLRVVITCLRGPFLDGLCSRFSLHPLVLTYMKMLIFFWLES